MKALESIVVVCPGCGRRATIDAEMLEARLDRPLSISSVGQLYRRLRCSGCASREIRIGDAAGRTLIDPAGITPCRACGCPIPLPRLEALPNTNICMPCAEDGAKPPAPAALPPAAGGQAKMSALRASDDRSPEQRGPGVLSGLHGLSKVPLDMPLR